MAAGCGPSISIIKLLKDNDQIPVRIYASDCNPMSAGLYLADEYFILPKANSDYFIRDLKYVCNEAQIDVVFAPLDIDIEVISKIKDSFERDTSTKVLCCNREQYKMTTNKSINLDVLSEYNVTIPESSVNRLTKDYSKVRIIKPIVGCGSKNHIILEKDEELNCDVPYEFICQEYIDGKEYSIDVLCDLNGNYITSVARERLEVRSGQTTKTRILKDSIIESYTKKVTSIFKIPGVSCLQCKVTDDNRIYFIELNSRYGTGIDLTALSGINMPLLHLKMALGYSISSSELDYKTITGLRYWNEVAV